MTSIEITKGIYYVGVNDRTTLNDIIKKISNIKGVKDVRRSN